MMMKAFSRAAAKKEGKSGNNFLDAILRERPDLQGQTAYFPEQGMFGYTVIIGDEVFKGPRYEDLAKSFDQEVTALQEVSGKGLPVPEVTCVGKETFFYGMTRVPGVTFESVMNKMSAEQLQSLAEELADFMIRMAKVVPRENGLFATQGDLREPNVLVDPETKKLTGIVDFGMAKDVTKDKLKPAFITNQLFRERVTEALNRRKSELPDLQSAAELKKLLSKGEPVDPALALEMFKNRPA